MFLFTMHVATLTLEFFSEDLSSFFFPFEKNASIIIIVEPTS